MTKFEKILFIIAIFLIAFAFQKVFSVDYKEKCLREGGTAVEYPKGTFERCIK